MDAAASPRRERHLAMRRAILRAAATEFRSRGFAATGMRDIAHAAGLSPANLYHYFASKQELLAFCQDHSLDRLLAACRAASRRGGPPPDRLASVVRAHLALTLDELDGAAAHLELDGLTRRSRERIVAKRDRYERALRRIIVAGVASGHFAACDTTLVTRAILGALNWTARWYDPEGRLPGTAVADAYGTYLVRGLLP
jgi:AcrR family transcriptional regulator